MDYMDQSVSCSVCGKETSSIVTGICFSCEGKAKEAARKAEWDAKSEPEKAISLLGKRSNEGGVWLEKREADLVLSQVSALAARQGTADLPRERELFEETYARLNGCARLGGWNDKSAETGFYEEVDVQDAWILWNAARLVPDAPAQPQQFCFGGEPIVKYEPGPPLDWSDDCAADLPAQPQPLNQAEPVGCKWPNCQTEEYQQKLGADVAVELFGASALRAEPASQPDAKTSIFSGPEDGKTVQVRIKRGAIIQQDFRSMRWPQCLAPRGSKINPEMVFDAVWNGRYWDCTAPGYGEIGDYGSGSIFVSKPEDIFVIEPESEVTDSPVPRMGGDTNNSSSLPTPTTSSGDKPAGHDPVLAQEWEAANDRQRIVNAAHDLREIGGAMSNVMFNLGQHAKREFTDQDADLFAGLCKRWDVAIRAFPGRIADLAPLAAPTDGARDRQDSTGSIRPSAEPAGQRDAWPYGFDKMHPECNCATCNPHMTGRMMFLCGTCGNKRCPHAANHVLACTNSNEPGQPGSLYGPPIDAAVASESSASEDADAPTTSPVAGVKSSPLGEA